MQTIIPDLRRRMPEVLRALDRPLDRTGHGDLARCDIVNSLRSVSEFDFTTGGETFTVHTNATGPASTPSPLPEQHYHRSFAANRIEIIPNLWHHRIGVSVSRCAEIGCLRMA